MLLEKFSRSLSVLFPDLGQDFTFNDWESAIRRVFELARGRRIVLAIDELPYLMDAVPEFASILQAAWDGRSEDCELVLILSGSHYQMMHSQFLSGRGPLFGRSTASLLLEEIEPSEIRLFLPHYSPFQIVETYSVIGGVPKYLEMWNDKRPVLTNIAELVLSPVTIFRHEAVFLIQDEIPEPRTYLAILEAIGLGAKTPTQIGKHAGILINHVGKYLHTLLAFELVRRIISLDAKDFSNTRKSRYEIKDPYLRFYFGFLHPNIHLIEQQRFGRILDVIRANWDSFVGKSGYEELARQLVSRLGDSGRLPFFPEQIGRAWNAHAEIDVVAVDRKSENVFLGECKWTSRKANEADLDALINKAKHFPTLKQYTCAYGLFSRTGFTSKLRRRASDENILLFDGPLLNSK